MAELLTHLLFADPSDCEAAQLPADTMEQLGYQSETGIWRSDCLSAALELRQGVHNRGTIDLAGPDVLDAITPEMLFDLAGVKLNGPKAWDIRLTVDWTVTDGETSDRYAMAS